MREWRRSAEEKLSVVEATKRLLSGWDGGKVRDLSRQIRSAENKLKVSIYPYVSWKISVAERYTFAASQAIYVKERLAKLLFAVQFLDWGLANKLPFRSRSGKSFTQLMIDILQSSTMKEFSADHERFVAAAIDALAEEVWLNKQLSAGTVRKSSALFNPIARRILLAILSYVSGGSMTGQRIGIFSQLGAGKTTLAYHSIYAVLRFLGMSDEEAMRVSSKLIINNPVEALEIFRYTTDCREFLPALVIDDASILLTKYWAHATKEVRQFVLKVTNVMKRAREGFGAILIPSDTYTSIAKGVRESIDISIEGVRVCDMPVTTLWTLFAKDVETEAALGRRNRGKRSWKIFEYAGTVHPPMFTPDPIYVRLTEEKLRLRSMQLREAKRLAPKVFSEFARQELMDEIEKIEDQLMEDESNE